MAQQVAKKEKKGFWNRIKETLSELKKVSWPSFKTVVKSTGIVLAVVLFFLIALIGIDSLLGFLYQLLTGFKR
ncbi:MAG: preprotein translocase subunit SecE [Firmicutes bacterium]|nr:preprotein translocase subunit SecE [Bacillota bacterium]MCL1953921.1 preprotein translocase subunit SecE [Bacillota bacterium]